MSAAPGLDVLAIGPHPDDVELFCGGTLARLAGMGYRVGVLDLTRGELATNGTPEQRAVEAAAAAEVLGLAHRENLGLPDGFIDPTGAAAVVDGTSESRTQLARLVSALRRLRPEIVLAPASAARHPDHEAASAVVVRAAFFANVGGFVTEPTHPRWAIRDVLFYPMRVAVAPSFCVDISDSQDAKRRAIRCYASQVQRIDGAAATLVNDPRAVEVVLARDAHWGAHLGVTAAEPFFVRTTLGVSDPVAFLRARPGNGALLFPERR